MKHLTSIYFKRWLFLLSFVICSLTALPAQIGDLIYSISSYYSSATVTGYTGNPRNIVIPETINVNGQDYPVTEIAKRAFADCKSLESITIPKSVTSIGTTYTYSSSSTSNVNIKGYYLPFYGCTSLKKVIFKDGNAALSIGAQYNEDPSKSAGLFFDSPVKEVYLGRNINYSNSTTGDSFKSRPSSYGYSAFYNKATLSKVTIGDNVTRLPEYMFYECKNLSSVNLGESLNSIPEYCFNNCNINIIDIHAKVVSIGEKAFQDNENLKYVKLSLGLKYINASAFSNCENLSNVDFPESLTIIGTYAFFNTGLQALEIPNSVTSIGDGAFAQTKIQKAVVNAKGNLPYGIFSNCKDLQECYLGDDVTAIGWNAFNGDSKLIKVVIGKSVENIGIRAFADCKSLESITIPKSVTSIGSTYMYSSDSIYDVDTQGYYLPFYGCISLKKVVFEDGEATLTIGAQYNDDSSKSAGLFHDSPLEEVYLGRNISYEKHYNSSSLSFSQSPYRYGRSAFYNKVNLSRVTIGDMVTRLPNFLFSGCENIQTLISLAKTAPSASQYTLEFSVNKLVTPTLFVPYKCKSDYSSAAYWSALTNIKEWFYDDICAYIPLDENSVEVFAHPVKFLESLAIPGEVTWEEGDFKVIAISENAFEGMENLTTLSLPANLERIGARAFKDCTKLNAITFNGQKQMGDEAFRNCTSLVNISLPNTLETIGNHAFRNANSITQIDFEEGLTEIGFGAFMDCNSLTAVRLPNTVTRVGDSAFENCLKLTYASIGENTEYLGNSAFRNCTVLTEVSIPGTTKTVGSKAFQNCKTLALATLNSGIETIGSLCFDGCAELLSMTIPGTVNSIGGGSFNGCTSLSSLSFSNGEEDLEIPMFTDSPLKTLRIGRNLIYPFSDEKSPFRDRTTLNRVMFTGNYVTRIYDYLLDGCNKVASITLPGTLEIINTAAFRNCSSLPNIVLPASLNEIKSKAFDGCGGLTAVTFNDSETSLTLGTANSMFHDSPLESLYIGRNIEYMIPETTYPEELAPFYQQKNLTDLKFSNNGFVTTLPYYFMYEAEKLPSVSFPASLQEIGHHAFYGNSQLSSVDFTENAELKEIGEYAFYGNSQLPSITLPDEVTTVGSNCFQNSTKMETIHLSDKLSGISSYLLAGCSSLKSITIPASVADIDTGAFNECSSLESAVIGNSVTPLQIGYDSPNVGMFCTTPLSSIYIGRNLTYSATEDDGYSPFHNMESLTDVSFSQAGEVTEVGSYLLDGCSSVKGFRLPESLAKINDNAFSNMTSLEYCNIPNSVNSLGKAVFMNDSKLESVVLSNKIPILDENLFNGCTVLNNLSIPASVKNMNKGAFSGCESMANLRIENGSEIMTVASKDDQNSLFADCPIYDLYLGRWLSYDVNTKTIAPFYAQSNLKKLSLGETVGTIGKYLFTLCTALQAVEIPDGVESIGEEAFNQCHKLSNLKLGEGLTSLGERAFANNVSLDNIKMPSTLTSISDGCFSNCTALVNLELNSNLGIIGPRAFEYCTSLGYVDIPSKVYGLGVEAFQNCASLSTITIPEGDISSIGARAFKDCSNISNVILGKNVTSLGVNCFQGCEKIMNVKSYNPIPPVGAPGFPQTVVDNGTIFVPNESVEDYKDSDTWWEFFNIRPFTDATLLTSIVLNKTEATIRDTETLLLSAITTPSDATDQTVLYRSSDTSVATVNNDGVVMGKTPGVAIITAYAADGSGAHAECSLTVNPTLIERLEASTEHSIKMGRTDKLSVKVYPENATDQSLSWVSDNTSVVRVDNDGTLTAVYKGSAKLTATANDGSNVSHTCIVTVIPPIKGDSNDDDSLTITDGVNTANYAMGKEVKNFCFEAADVDEDNQITFDDASGTVSIILDTPLMSTVSNAQVLATTTDTDSDFLKIDDFASESGETISINIGLNDTQDYVALQADLVMPEGLLIESIKAGARAINHSLLTKQIDDNTTRIILFDPTNPSFSDGDEPLLTLNVKVISAPTSNVQMNNILSSDPEANEYMLTSTGGYSHILSNISETRGAVKVFTEGNEIKVNNAEGYEITICDIDGAVISHFTAKSNTESVNMEAGIYIVKVGALVEKITI